MNKKVILGFRPENLYLKSDIDENNDRFTHIDTIVRLAEMLGSETLIHFKIDDRISIAKINTLEDFERNQPISLALDTNFIHFFDRDSQDRIILDNSLKSQTERRDVDGSDVNLHQQSKQSSSYSTTYSG